MKKRRLSMILPIAVISGFILMFGLAGCVEPDEQTPVSVVRSVTVAPAPDHGIVFDGEEGVLHYIITIDGENIFPIDLLGQYVELGVRQGNLIAPIDGISINEGTETVTASGQRVPLLISVDGLSAGTFNLAVSVHGQIAAFQVIVDPPTNINSVAVVPAPNHGAVSGGEQGVLNYLISVSGTPSFPVNLREDVIFRIITPEGQMDLPSTISVNSGTILPSNVTSAPLSFSVNSPHGGTYSLIAIINRRQSAPFSLVINPSALTGEAAIRGTPAIVGQNLQAVSDLPGSGFISHVWQRSPISGTDFVDIPGANSNFYTVQNTDVNHIIRVVVKREGFTGYVASNPTALITDPQNPPIQGTLTVSGTASVGSTLQSAVSGLSSGASPVFQWQRGLAGIGFIDIPGAAGDSYLVSDDDSGFALRVTVTSDNFRGYLYSAPTGVVPAALVTSHLRILRAANPPPASTVITTVVEEELLAPQFLYFGGANVSVTIRGGSNNSVLALDGSGAMFTVGRGVTLVFENIELRGSNNNSSALVVVNGGTLVVGSNSIITGNRNTSTAAYVSGGGLSVTNSGEIIVDGGKISGNRAEEGGGIFANNGSSIQINSGTISGNTADAGGGVIAEDTDFVMLGGSIIDNNATLGGGVMTYSGGNFNMDNGLIAENTALRGGGVFVGVAGSFLLRGGLITENTATSNGGGVFVSSSQVGVDNRAIFRMENGIITDNEALQGGGVNIGQNGQFSLIDGIVSDNRAIGTIGSSGGGVFSSGVSGSSAFLTMNGGIITGNTATNTGGGVANRAYSQFVFNDGLISGNNTQIGGGVFNIDDGGFWMFGGSITDNDAEEGGGISNRGFFFIEEGIVYGINAEPEVANTADAGDVLLTAPGAVSWGGQLSNTGAVIASTVFDIPSHPLPGLNYTLHVEDGVLAQIISPTGMRLTGINEDYIGGRGRVFLRPSPVSSWTLMTGAETDITSTEVTFMWPNFVVAIATWEVRIEFWDNHNLVSSYVGDIPLERGVTTVPFSAFNETTHIQQVTSITISNIPELYLNRNLSAILWMQVGQEWRLVSVPVEIESSITIIPTLVMPTGFRDLEIDFVSFGTTPPVLVSTYRITNNFTHGGHTLPHNTWTWVDPAGAAPNTAPLGHGLNQPSPNRLIPNENRVLPEMFISSDVDIRFGRGTGRILSPAQRKDLRQQMLTVQPLMPQIHILPRLGYQPHVLRQIN